MIVNGKTYNIDDLLKSIDMTSNKLETVGNLMLTKREVEVLERNYIDFRISTNLRDLMMKIQFALEDDEYDEDDKDELESVLESISERAYYEETNK